MATVENKVENNNVKTKKSSYYSKPLWSDSEDELDDSDSKKKEKKSTSEQNGHSTKVSSTDNSLTSEFNSKWDRFPTSEEFKNLYGEEIWDQLQSNYNDLAKSVIEVKTSSETSQPKKEKEKRTTCWDALDVPIGNVDDSSSAYDSKDVHEPNEKRRMGRPPGIKNGEGVTRNKGPGKFQCHLCDNKFDSIAQARAHLQTHSGVKPFKCAKCDYRSYSKFNVTNNHWSNKHGRKGGNDDVTVDEAEKEKIRQFVIKEQEKVYPVSENDTKPEKRANEETTTNNDNEDTTENKRPKLDMPKTERRYQKVMGQLKCNHCDKNFETMVLVRGHLQVHADIRPYKCNKCDYKSYSRNNVINNHWTNNHGRKAGDDDVDEDMDEKLNLKKFIIEESEKIYNQMLENKKQDDIRKQEEAKRQEEEKKKEEARLQDEARQKEEAIKQEEIRKQEEAKKQETEEQEKEKKQEEEKNQEEQKQQEGEKHEEPKKDEESKTEKSSKEDVIDGKVNDTEEEKVNSDTSVESNKESNSTEIAPTSSNENTEKEDSTDTANTAEPQDDKKEQNKDSPELKEKEENS